MILYIQKKIRNYQLSSQYQVIQLYFAVKRFSKLCTIFRKCQKFQLHNFNNAKATAIQSHNQIIFHIIFRYSRSSKILREGETQTPIGDLSIRMPTSILKRDEYIKSEIINSEDRTYLLNNLAIINNLRNFGKSLKHKEIILILTLINKFFSQKIHKARVLSINCFENVCLID